MIVLIAEFVWHFSRESKWNGPRSQLHDPTAVGLARFAVIDLAFLSGQRCPGRERRKVLRLQCRRLQMGLPARKNFGRFLRGWFFPVMIVMRVLQDFPTPTSSGNLSGGSTSLTFMWPGSGSCDQIPGISPSQSSRNGIRQGVISISRVGRQDRAILRLEWG